jgi:signal transduction histidine kinase
MVLTYRRRLRAESAAAEGFDGLDGADRRLASGDAGLPNGLPINLDNQDALRLATLGIKTMDLANELGNLLQVIASAVRLIDRQLDQATSFDVRPFTQGALASVDRAAALRSEILELSRSESATCCSVMKSWDEPSRARR